MKGLFWAMWDLSRIGTAGPGRVIRNRVLRRARGRLAGLFFGMFRIMIIGAIIIAAISYFGI